MSKLKRGCIGMLVIAVVIAGIVFNEKNNKVKAAEHMGVILWEA